MRDIRTAVVFTANTPHVAHANLMLDSIRDQSKGNYKGDVWVISTGLSDRAKRFLERRNVKYFEDTMDELKEWKYFDIISNMQTDNDVAEDDNDVTEAERRKLVFEQFRNKRMSKLIIVKWNEMFGKDYDFIAICDNDLYFQRDLNELFLRYYSRDCSKYYYWHEENGINPGSFLWEKDYQYANYHSIKGLDFGKHEINIGFLMGTPGNISALFQKVRELFDKVNSDLITKYKWHDQDMVRLIRAKEPTSFQLVDEGDILHLCNGGRLVIEQRYPMEFYHKKTGLMPYVLHFAGGTWGKYTSIKSTFEVDPDMYFHYEEMMDK